MTAPTQPRLVVNAFAGPGGWCEGLRLAGYSDVNLGIEWDEAACRTAEAAGHLRIRADVAKFPIEEFAGLVWGYIGSPPCTTFSGAGHGAGRLVTEILLTAMTRMARGLLQSFRPGYPWQGTKSKQYEGVGNAMPPLLAAAVLRPLFAHLSAAAAA